jgi:hypothetical protein
LDYVIVLNETGLRRILKSYFGYYERSRTHLSLGKDAPIARPIQAIGTGAIMTIPQVGGLHPLALNRFDHLRIRRCERHGRALRT